MKSKLAKLALTAIFGLASAFTFSCSDSGGGNNNAPPPRKEKISGVSQKGPFEVATVKIHKLNANMEPIGEPYEGITDSIGNFDIEVEEGMQYISLEVDGKYVSEVSGLQSTKPMTLKAVADVSNKDKVNINVFTHLEYDRVLNNPASRVNFNNAKREAQKNVLKALGMSENVAESSEDLTLFGSNASDSLLLAASVLLQANRSTEDVSNLLDTIGSKIKVGAALSQSTKDSLVRGAKWVKDNIDSVMRSIRRLDANAKVPRAEDIGNIVAGINGSSSSGSSSIAQSSSGGANGNDIRNYKTVTIGTQTWMAENLNYAVEGSRCYGNKEENCNIYGRLYDWATAMNIDKEYNSNLTSSSSKHQGICPSGWHIPSNADWNILMKFVNSDCFDNENCENAGTELKAKSGWDDGGNGTDSLGFSALPGGRVYSNGTLFNVGRSGSWWSASEYNNSDSYDRYMDNNYNGVGYSHDGKSGLFSVRCVKD